MPAEVSDEITLFASAPRAQSGPVASMTCFSRAVGGPYRVGVPHTIASAHSGSSWAASGRCRVSDAWVDHSSFEAIASAGGNSATCRSRTSAPAGSAPATIA